MLGQQISVAVRFVVLHVAGDDVCLVVEDDAHLLVLGSLFVHHRWEMELVSLLGLRAIDCGCNIGTGHQDALEVPGNVHTE